MGINLDTLLAAGMAAIAPVEDIVSDVKAGIAAGGGALAETEAVVLALLADSKFKADLSALVNAAKAL